MTTVRIVRVPEDAGATLQSRLIGFTRVARDNGFRVGIAEEIDALRTALFCNITDPQRLRWGLKSLLCSHQNDWNRFDEMFDAYWLPANVSTRYHSAKEPQLLSQAARPEEMQDKAACHVAGDMIGTTGDQDAGEEGLRDGASAQESLMREDFRFLAERGQMHEIEELVERLARNMRRRFRRREKLKRHGRRIHLRRSLRNSLRFGGIPFQLAYRQRHKRQPRLLLVVDVSRSMSMYSVVFLRFARALVKIFSSAEAFAFHTHLVHISQAMRRTDLVKMQNSLTAISQGWSGGTRIGDSLQHLTREYGRWINSRSIVVIVSDGLDTGEPSHLARQLASIKDRCRKLVWLNPLLGRQGYEPRTAGMVAALPFIDLFAPAHNLASLAVLEHALIKL